MVTLRSKSSPIAKMRLRKEDREFYFYAGKCSGRFAAEVETPSFTVQASGGFTDIECFAIAM
jgi:hypothetical protein